MDDRPHGDPLACYDPRPAMSAILQREHWNGRPTHLGELFTLRKSKAARQLVAPAGGDVGTIATRAAIYPLAVSWCQTWPHAPQRQ